MVVAAFLVDRSTEQKVCYGGRKIKKVAIVGFFCSVEIRRRE
jgi:hypothetical protein